MLMTAMSRKVGLNELATEKEVELVTETVRSMSSIAISTFIEPLKSELLDSLGGCGIVHSACHGIAYSEDASSGSLFLRASTNEAPERLMVRELAGFRHSLAQIAYLCACPTAESSSISLANEVIHIAAFQLLEFPHVIGTLREAANQYATEVTGAFYGNLVEQLKESGLYVSHDVVAYALRHATRELSQKKLGNAIGWTLFINIGAQEELGKGL
jgi:CHAT domain-containing protein